MTDERIPCVVPSDSDGSINQWGGESSTVEQVRLHVTQGLGWKGEITCSRILTKTEFKKMISRPNNSIPD